MLEESNERVQCQSHAFSCRKANLRSAPCRMSGSIIEEWERHTFPNVVGCELFRAKAMIKWWLKVKIGYDEDINYVIYDHKLRNALTKPIKDGSGLPGKPRVSQQSKQIILWYDFKFDAVAITPVWFGSVEQIHLYEKEHEDNDVIGFD